MTNRMRLWVRCCSVAVVISLFVGVWLATRRQSKLNILIVTLDTTRADRLGCYGYAQALTPAMDSLAASGTQFDRAYASAPLTLPSHATLFSGLYPPEHGLHANGQNSLAEQVPVLAEILQKQGYATGGFVAAFVLDSKFGLDRGFGTYDDRLSDDPHPGHDALHRNRPGNLVVDSALKWLSLNDKQPFLCWVHLYDPHFPYIPHQDDFGNRFVDRPYDGDLAFVDQQLKRLVDHLKSRSLDQKTLIVVVGDHGEGLGDHGERTHGNMLYNSCLNVPLIFALPNSSSLPRRVAEPVSLTDVFPTILDCLELSPPQPVSGRSLKPALRGQPVSSGACYSETDEPFHAARCSPLQCLITEQWKFIRTPRQELFDLKNDPQELKNLAAAHPEQVQRLSDLLVKLEQGMTRRDAPQAKLSPAEERALNTLGYTGRQSDPDAVKAQGNLPDTKDMLPYFNQCDDALKEMTFKNYSGAEKILKPVVKAAPSYFEARCSLGVCYYSQKKYSEAATEYQKALEMGASPATVNIQLGMARVMLKDYEAALGNFSEALTLQPEDPEIHYFLGFTLQKLKRFSEAMAEFDQALELNPQFAPALKAANELSRRLDPATP